MPQLFLCSNRLFTPARIPRFACRVVPLWYFVSNAVCHIPRHLRAVQIAEGGVCLMVGFIALVACPSRAPELLCVASVSSVALRFPAVLLRGMGHKKSPNDQPLQPPRVARTGTLGQVIQCPPMLFCFSHARLEVRQVGATPCARGAAFVDQNSGRTRPFVRRYTVLCDCGSQWVWAPYLRARCAATTRRG